MFFLPCPELLFTIFTSNSKPPFAWVFLMLFIYNWPTISFLRHILPGSPHLSFSYLFSFSSLCTGFFHISIRKNDIQYPIEERPKSQRRVTVPGNFSSRGASGLLIDLSWLWYWTVTVTSTVSNESVTGVNNWLFERTFS